MQWQYILETGELRMFPESSVELDLTLAMHKLSNYGGKIAVKPSGDKVTQIQIPGPIKHSSDYYDGKD